MRLSVMAAERAATMATTIHRIWRHVGQPCTVARAASNAPVSAKGSANTECSNLIISRIVRMRLPMASALRFLCRIAAGPAKHFLQGQARLRQDAANVLHHQIVDGFRLVIK